MRYIDVVEEDVDGDRQNEVFILSIPWSVMTKDRQGDPGEYWYFNAYKKIVNKYEKIKIKTDNNTIEKLEIPGVRVTGYPTSLDGSAYIKFGDNNMNGLLEIYLVEYAFGSSPGTIHILEFKNDRLVEIFSESVEIEGFFNADEDSIPEFITDVYYQSYGILPELYPYMEKIYKYENGHYKYSKELTIKYVQQLIEYSKSNLESTRSFDNYLGLLKELLQLGNLGVESALPQAEEIIEKYHHHFIGIKMKFGEVPSKEEMLRDVRNKINE